MNNLRVIRLQLDALNLDSVEGCGDKVTVNVTAERVTRTGRPERYHLAVEVCRYGVRDLLVQLRKMHARDRDRINRELTRINNEANTLNGDANG